MAFSSVSVISNSLRLKRFKEKPGVLPAAAGAPVGVDEREEGPEMMGKAKDPVCSMTIKKKDAAATSEYRGKTIYFCNKACKEEFDKDPDKYAAAVK